MRDRLLNTRDVCEMLNVSNCTLYNIRCRDDEFPEPVKKPNGASGNKKYWRFDDINHYIKTRDSAKYVSSHQREIIKAEVERQLKTLKADLEDQIESLRESFFPPLN